MELISDYALLRQAMCGRSQEYAADWKMPETAVGNENGVRLWYVGSCLCLTGEKPIVRVTVTAL
jgi:hypothetical protein